MDLMQMAGHLSLEFDATVTGPFMNRGERVVHVMRPDGYGVAVLAAPESEPGKFDVWSIRKTSDPHKVDVSNTPDMVRFGTDLDGAREALRVVGPATWAAHGTRNAHLKK